MTVTPFFQPGQSVTFKSGAVATCEVENFGCVGVWQGRRLGNSVISGLFDLVLETASESGQFASVTSELPQGVHKGGGGNVSPAGDVLVTVAHGTAENAIPGRGADNDVWLLDVSGTNAPAPLLQGQDLTSTEKSWARFWPVGLVDPDSERFSEFVVAQVSLVASPRGPLKDPMGDDRISRYALVPTGSPILVAEYAEGQFMEPYGYFEIEGRPAVVFTADFDAANYQGARIHYVFLDDPGATPHLLAKFSDGDASYEEFYNQLPDGRGLFCHAYAQLGMDVWVCGNDGSSPVQVTNFNSLTSKRECCQIALDPSNPLAFFVTLQEGGPLRPMVLNTYRVVLPS